MLVLVMWSTHSDEQTSARKVCARHHWEVWHVATSSAGRDIFDIVVIGGGAAGLSGAKITARSRRSVLVIDSGAPRNAPAEGVHNYLYAEGTSPAKLGEIGRTEAAVYGVQVVAGSATSATVIDEPGEGQPRFTVTIAGQDGGARTVWARRLLLTTGLVDVLPDIPGVVQRWGRDVLHCPFCHGWEVRDRAVGVIGTGPMAFAHRAAFRPTHRRCRLLPAHRPGPH